MAQAQYPEIHLYTFCHNEEFIIPYFLRHYLPLVSKIIVFDNDSTDGSVRLLKKHDNIFVKRWDTHGKYREDLKWEITNTIWKKSRGHAGFVMIVDIDEFLYHPDLTNAIIDMKGQGYSVLKPVGYDMISTALPSTSDQIYHEIVDGVRRPDFDKMVLFDPNLIENMNFSPGGHHALPEGKVKVLMRDDQFKLLHYRYLGLDHLLKKHASRARRMSEENRKLNLGYHYLFDEKKLYQIFHEMWDRREQIL